MSYRKLAKILQIVTLSALSLVGCATNKSHPSGKVSMKDAKASYQAGNYAEAIQQLHPLAEAGNPDAQYSLGYLYFYGKGVTEDRATGAMWIRKAATKGQRTAIRALEQLEKIEQTPQADVMPETPRRKSGSASSASSRQSEMEAPNTSKDLH
jgi:TPR repeat protein